MAEVGVAAGAADFRTRHAKAVVGEGDDIFRRHRLPETRPAGAGFEFGAGIEQVVAAADALKDAFTMFMQEPAAKSRLGAMPAGDLVLFGRELLSPFLITLDDLLGGDISPVFTE